MRSSFSLLSFLACQLWEWGHTFADLILVRQVSEMKTSLSAWAHIAFYVWEWVNACIDISFGDMYFTNWKPHSQCCRLLHITSENENVVISCMSPLRMRSHICRLNSSQTRMRMRWLMYRSNSGHRSLKKMRTSFSLLSFFAWNLWEWRHKFQRLKTLLSVWAYIAFHVWEWVNACIALALFIYISQIENLIFSVVVYCISPLRMRWLIYRSNSGHRSLKKCEPLSQCCHFLHVTYENEVTHLQT